MGFNAASILPKISLAQVPLFRGLSTFDLKLIQDVIREKVFHKGDILLFDGKACDQIVIVRSGRIKVFRTAATGREQILEILNPGDTCACNPGAAAWCCSSTSQALTDCDVWIFPRDKYNQMVKSNPQLAQSLNKIFAARLQKFSSLIEEVSLDDPKRRLVKLILDSLALENNFVKHEEIAEIFLTHEEIAQRLGLVRETITRHLQQLKRADLIDLQPRRIVVRNRQGLQALVI
ncbi:MAG: Crp/Fnr family transcriptional regulator [Candidatus Omnitrophica bacterium]|nr:Crp/Fnr family transcriptional regulator [Candidatus Omnitrophota bacterium]